MFTSRLRCYIGLLAIALYCSVAVVESAPTKGSAPAPKSNGRAATPATGSKLTSGPGKCKAKFKRKPGAGGWKEVAPKSKARGPKGSPALLSKISKKSSNQSPPPNKSTPQGSGGKKKRSEFELVPRAITKLYHITGATGAENIVTNGVLLNCVGDFSPQGMPGFYLAAATDRDALIRWCKSGGRECTKLVEFDYNPPATLTQFRFNPNNDMVDTWADSDDFCKYNEFAGWCMTGSKNGEAFPTGELTGNYAALQTVDVVIGPIVDDYTWNQYTMRTQAALTALGPPLQVLDVPA